MNRIEQCWGAALAVAACAAAAQADFLLENQTLPGGGRAVSAQWTIFQPFMVPEPGWHVTTIGVDGFVSQDPLGFGMLGALLPDNGSGTPDEGRVIASAAYYMGDPQFPAASQWRDVDFDVYLSPGNYWMRWSSNGDIGYFGTVWRATNGIPSYSRNEFTGAIFNSDPTALRIAGTVGPSCPGDLNGDNQVDLADLAQLLANYGVTSGATYEDGDLDGDGDVDLGDLAALLAIYGVVC